MGGTVGGISGALIGMGIPEYEGCHEGKVKGGNALISVHSENSEETARAKKIFEGEEAEDISSKEEAAVAKKVGNHRYHELRRSVVIATDFSKCSISGEQSWPT